MEAQKEKDPQNNRQTKEPGEGHVEEKKDQSRIQRAKANTLKNPQLGQMGMGGALQQFVMGTVGMKHHPQNRGKVWRRQKQTTPREPIPAQVTPQKRNAQSAEGDGMLNEIAAK
ncbi:unnamed protein product [Linum trigynum]|uniref:Uncharacterized protein n=1 Tax=Linum trigynum TaxID=586398 RepID=A0AAV2E924_9ROSI